MFKLIILEFCLLYILFNECSMTVLIGNDTKESIDTFIQTAMACSDMVSLNLALIHEGQTLYTTGYGFKDLTSRTPVTEHSLLGIASMTKAMATALLGQLLEENGFSWDMTVREALGEDFYFNTGLRTKQTTLRDIASHSVGLAGNNFMRLQGATREDIVQKVRFLEASRDLRSYIYNNIMFGVLAHVTEIIGGDTWENLMHLRVFQPLGMYNTVIVHTDNLTNTDLAKSYLLDNDGKFKEVSIELQKEWGNIGASGSILTSASDVAKWLHVQLNYGLTASKDRVFSEKVIKETRRTVNGYPISGSAYKRPNIPLTYDDSKYALGWRGGFYNGYTMNLHTGTSWGYGGLITLLPDMNIGIFTSHSGLDSSYAGRRLIHMYIADLILGEILWVNSTNVCQFVKRLEQPSKYSEPQSKRDSLATKDYKKYKGTYGNFAYGNITVQVNESNGELEMNYGDLGHWRLVEQADGIFKAEGLGVTWMISINPVSFYSSTVPSGIIDKVSVAYESDSLPVFTRDLLMSDAPQPPPLSCDTKKNILDSIVALIKQ